MIYLDNASTTKVDPKVVKAMLPYFSDKYGNASSQHSKGQEAKMALEESRAIIAKSIGARPDEIIFTSGGTESNNLTLKGIMFANPNKPHLITTKIEHDCILKSSKFLEKHGMKVTYLNVDKHGFVDIKDLEKTITKDTALVSIIHANNEIGTIQNLEEIGKICRKYNVLFHTDACQSYTKAQINVKKQNLDLVTLNSHKIHGPKGVGALYIKKGTKIFPMTHGGGHEYNLRSGTENIPGIVGFAKAVKLAKPKYVRQIEKLRNKLIKGISKIKDVKLNGPIKNRLCNNINFSIKGVEGESVGAYLDIQKVCSSTGSACSSHTLEPSHVLRAIGRSHLESNSSLRLSLSRYNTEQEIDYVLKIIPKIIEKVRKISGVKDVQ